LQYSLAVAILVFNLGTRLPKIILLVSIAVVAALLTQKGFHTPVTAPETGHTDYICF
jgi:hypothetical protein